MELLQNLALGFGVAFTFQNLLYAFMGTLLGTLIGVLPGLGPVAAIAMLLPSIYALDVHSFIFHFIGQAFRPACTAEALPYTDFRTGGPWKKEKNLKTCVSARGLRN